MPLLVLLAIVQVVFCGALLKLHGVPGLEQLSWLVPSRWALGAMAGTIGLAPDRAGRPDRRSAVPALGRGRGCSTSACCWCCPRSSASWCPGCCAGTSRRHAREVGPRDAPSRPASGPPMSPRQHGMPAWETPDPARPAVPLDPLLPVQLVERRGDWASRPVRQRLVRVGRRPLPGRRPAGPARHRRPRRPTPPTPAPLLAGTDRPWPATGPPSRNWHAASRRRVLPRRARRTAARPRRRRRVRLAARPRAGPVAVRPRHAAEHLRHRRGAARHP